MQELNKAIHRISAATRRDRGQERAIVSSLLPPAYIGFRIAGRVQTFLLDIEVAYELAIKQYARDVERLALRIRKDEGIRLASARKRAEKAMRDEINGIVRAAKAKSKRPSPRRADGKCCDYHKHGGDKERCLNFKGGRHAA